ncbi:diguanylate cyclase domain protein [Pediococcus claussenii ATCC BAA-344]|uniref:Diguanylate cyclase domain protein n=2 Tax=Pediococcus claussenii TaxID=187452 RepID=G8PC60_PEDCP|nr:diguanylate cyclase domain protein [Pediococcus claussenii ATCC BAA-344]
MGVFTVGVLFLLVFFAYLIENFTKKIGRFQEIISWGIWILLLGACMLFLQGSFSILDVNSSAGWEHSNLQLAVLFYCIYNIRNKGILIFNLIMPIVVYGSQSGNGSLSNQVMFLICYFILAVVVIMIDRFADRLIDSGFLYWLSMIIFAISWWIIIWGLYRFNVEIMLVRIADFIVGMGIIHFFNRFVRNIFQQYVGLKHDVQFDELTGAKNRASFDQVAEEVYQVYKKESVPLSMAMFDIDNFKNFNDTYGHLIGDEILKKVVKHFQKELFQKRTGGEIFRIGGEEFFVILRGYDSKKASKVITDIRDDLFGEPIMIGDRQVRITISCGITMVNGNDTNFKKIFERLDSYLYASKNSGKNRMTVEGTIYDFSS